jgi:ribonucleoside-diphosphate reductase alpha chain
MSARQRLPNRHASEQFTFTWNGLPYVATISFFPDRQLAEIFLNNAKAGSHSDSSARDSAVVCSLALQHGVPLQTIRNALACDSQGQASSPLGEALDRISNMHFNNSKLGSCYGEARHEPV